MSDANAAQIAEWNGTQGQRWVELQAQTDHIVVPFGDAAMQRAAALPGERAIDVGCGCGDTSIELARRVGPGGAVLGVDVSRPMLQAARARALQAGSLRLEFREADASTAALPADTDLLYSRFGLMFFDQPAPALRHLRASLRTGGRLAFVCWRAPRDNGWAMAPLVAARKALGVVAAPTDPHAPGPFAFADADRVQALLAQAGFDGIAIERFDAPILLGATPLAAAETAARIGPASRLIREHGLARLPTVVDAMAEALAPLAQADGRVSLTGSSWIVSAANP